MTSPEKVKSLMLFGSTPGLRNSQAASWLPRIATEGLRNFFASTIADRLPLDKVPAGAVIVCEQAEPLVVAKTITIARPLTLRGLKAKLQEKLGNTPLLVVAAGGVTLTDLTLHGNASLLTSP